MSGVREAIAGPAHSPHVQASPALAAPDTTSDPEPRDAVRQTTGFDELYHQFFRSVVRWCRALGAPERDLEDLAHDVFTVVHRKLSAFDGRSPEAWLYEITRRTVSDYRRRAWFRSLFARSDLVGAHADSADKRPDERLHASREQERFWRLVARLDERQRVPLVLFEIEGESGEAIAAALGIPLKTVWTRLHHGRKRLAELVRAETGGDLGKEQP